ncbi:MAG: hypothetical protein ACJ8E2_11550 [Bradyrhizobium sp.]|jgi:hypothetical protein
MKRNVALFLAGAFAGAAALTAASETALAAKSEITCTTPSATTPQ